MVMGAIQLSFSTDTEWIAETKLNLYIIGWNMYNDSARNNENYKFMVV